MVRDTLIELARVVTPGGHVAFEVGEVRKGKVLLEKVVWEAAEGFPFDRLFVMVDQQEFTKTANCWGVGTTQRGRTPTGSSSYAELDSRSHLINSRRRTHALGDVLDRSTLGDSSEAI